MTDMIQISVKSVDGKKFNVRVQPSDNCAKLIEATAATCSYEAKTIRLIHAGKDISDCQAKTLTELGIETGSTMFLVLRLNGGQASSIRLIM